MNTVMRYKDATEEARASRHDDRTIKGESPFYRNITLSILPAFQELVTHINSYRWTKALHKKCWQLLYSAWNRKETCAMLNSIPNVFFVVSGFTTVYLLCHPKIATLIKWLENSLEVEILFILEWCVYFSRASSRDIEERKFLCEQTKKKVDQVYKLITYLMEGEIFLENITKKTTAHASGAQNGYPHYQVQIRKCLIAFEGIYRAAEEIYRMNGLSWKEFYKMFG